MTQLIDDLLREAHRAALKHYRLKGQVIDALYERYGTLPSSFSYEDTVGAYDSGTVPTVVDCDLLMGASGCFPKDMK